MRCECEVDAFTAACDDVRVSPYNFKPLVCKTLILIVFDSNLPEGNVHV